MSMLTAIIKSLNAWRRAPGIAPYGVRWASGKPVRCVYKGKEYLLTGVRVEYRRHMFGDLLTTPKIEASLLTSTELAQDLFLFWLEYPTLAIRLECIETSGAAYFYYWENPGDLQICEH